MFTMERHRWVVDVSGVDVLVYVGQVSWFDTVYGGERGHPVWGPLLRFLRRNHCVVVHSLETPKRVLWHGPGRDEDAAVEEAREVVAGLRSGAWHWTTAATPPVPGRELLRRPAAKKVVLGGVCSAIAALASVGAWRSLVDPADDASLDACALVPAPLLRELGVPPGARAFEPEGEQDGATACAFGRGEPGVYATVFAIPHGGRAMVEQQQLVLERNGITRTRLVAAEGYRTYKSAGPRERSESIVVLHGDRYVNVILFNAEPGAIDRLLEPVVAAL